MPSLRAMASFAFELAAASLAPPRCAACDGQVSWLTVFCGACGSAIEPADVHETGPIAAFAYGGSVALAIARLKYEGRPDLGRPLGDLLWRAVASRRDELRGALVVPVPLHPSRLAERGYNQSALIAARVARGLGSPLRALALKRTRPTPRQTTLDRGARRANVADAFRAPCPHSVRNRTVLVVDDVRTTGATLDACARALQEAGALAIRCAVVAQARPGGEMTPFGPLEMHPP